MATIQEIQDHNANRGNLICKAFGQDGDSLEKSGKRSPEGTIATRANGYKFIKKNGKWEYYSENKESVKIEQPKSEDLLKLGYQDTITSVGKKFGIDQKIISKLQEIGESSISDREMYDQVSKLIGEKKAIAYMDWIGAENYKSDKSGDKIKEEQTSKKEPEKSEKISNEDIEKVKDAIKIIHMKWQPVFKKEIFMQNRKRAKELIKKITGFSTTSAAWSYINNSEHLL